jgi:NlpC/P60 family protein
MFATVTLLTLVNSVSGTPYVSGGDSPRGTDCSGLVSWVANAATGRPIYGDRFNTGNIERALLARGFQYGSQPGALNVGWNGGHTAATLPDGTPVSSGEGGGVRVGGGGAFQRQFSHHMFLPVAVEEAPAPDAMPAPDPMMPFAPPPPEMVPPPAPEAPIVMMAGEAPAPEMAPPPPADPFAPPPPPADPFAPPAPADIPPPA